MDEIWERAVETALDGQTDITSVRILTLDGAVKCVHGRLPAPSLFDKFPNLQHLSIANIGVSSLEHFPKLGNLQKLILSDNRISGGLEFLVQAGLQSLRDLDLSNNRICDVDVLRPLAELRLVSLDLYECPVTRVKDYRSIVFGLIRSLRFLDKMDVDGNEKAESDEDEEEDDVDDDEEEEEEDPGSGEVDGEENRIRLLSNGNGERDDGVVEVDESDADEEETETVRGVVNGTSDVGSLRFGDEEGLCLEEEEEEDDEYGGEEEDEDDDEDDEVEEEENDDVVEVHEAESDDDEEDGVEDEEVDNDEMGFEESNGRLTSTEGEIDGHEQGEEDADEDDDGETGEEELDLGENGEFDDEEEDEEEDNDNGYLVQPVGRTEVNVGGSDVGDEDEEDPEMDEEEDDDDGEVQELAPSSSHPKRKRDDSDDDDDDSDEDSEDDDIVEPSKSSKRR